MVKYIASDCVGEYDDGKHYKTRIIEKRYSNGVIYYTLGIVANCAGIHSVTIGFDSGILSINYLYGIFEKQDTLDDGQIEQIYSISSCDCFYKLSLQILNLPNKKIPVKLNDKEIFYDKNPYDQCKEKYDLANGDTINYWDMYCRKQGPWLSNKTDTSSYWKIYKNNEIDRFKKCTYKQGVLKTELTYQLDKEATFIEYHTGKDWYTKCIYKTAEDFEQQKEAIKCSTIMLDR